MIAARAAVLVILACELFVEKDSGNVDVATAKLVLLSLAAFGFFITEAADRIAKAIEDKR